MNTNFQQLSLPYIEFLEQYEWDLFATLTTPYLLSLPSTERTIVRFEHNVQKAFPSYRIFWVAEVFQSKSYHIHLVGSFNGDSKTFSEKRAIVQNCWDKAAAVKKRSVSKVVKHKRKDNAIKYILKNLQRGKIGYGVSGNSWSIDTK